MKINIFPYEVQNENENNKSLTFYGKALTVREVLEARDGVSKAGKNYHMPPRVIFNEDPQGDEWAWKSWDDQQSKFVDFPGPFPNPGDVMEFKLKATPRADGEGYYRDVYRARQTAKPVELKSDIADLDVAAPSAAPTNKVPYESRPAKGMAFNTLTEMLTSGKFKEWYGVDAEEEARKTWLFGFVASASGGVPFENFNDITDFDTWTIDSLFKKLRGETEEHVDAPSQTESKTEESVEGDWD